MQYIASASKSLDSGPIAQLDRVPDYESGGRGFESSPVHHKNPTVILYLFMSSQLIFSVKDALVRYKETPVFENLDLNIHQGSRIALVGKNGAGKVILRAAPAGTGIIAGGAIRSVCEVLGIQDVVAKSLGSANPHNVLKACVDGLKSQNTPKLLSAIRGKKISDIVLKRETK